MAMPEPTTLLPIYWYEGHCPRTGEVLRLPRTPESETVARELMRELANDDRYAQEGKMYGVLLAKTATGELQVLRAFSGLLWGQSMVPGWVPPLPGRETVALAETQTVAQLDRLKQELIALQQIPERQQYEQLKADFADRWQRLITQHQQQKHDRQQQRQQLCATLMGEDLAQALEPLNEQSRREGIEQRRFKREREEQLSPLKQIIDRADREIQILKQTRKQISRDLQAQLHAAYQLTNFAGVSLALQQVFPGGAMPTGTGDCCAPKLLHQAATLGLKPQAMAEFWWGPSTPNGDKVQGEFYGACAERCQPLMGFLLSGLSIAPVPILYQDDWLIVVDKPSGLLSVPGRYWQTQDSVVSRLRLSHPQLPELRAVHRLDQDTSGLLVLACEQATYRHLSQQFEQRQVHKVYEAILDGCLLQEQGSIELPLWADPDDRPRQKVDWLRGKPSRTYFQVVDRWEQGTRIEFMPETGRTHQLRVHAADAAGLGIPIRGDRLYGNQPYGNRDSHRGIAGRLLLHAKEIEFYHPGLKRQLYFKIQVPF